MNPDIDSSPLSLIPADVLHQVLAKLPFPVLVSLRLVCKKWNAMICSFYFTPPYHVPKCVPVHFLNDELTVYNSRIKAWEKHSLSFFQDYIQTTRLELVATTGGLMCFKTDQSSDLIVCNPISKIWKLLKIPSSIREELLNVAALAPHSIGEVDVASSRFDFSAAAEHHRELLLRKRTTITGLLVDPVSGNHYKIVVASLQDKSAPRCTNSTVVYDSQTNSWKKGAKVPEGKEFSDGDAILCNGSLYCLVKTETLNGELFRYDVESDRWSTLSLDMSVMRCKLVEHSGRVLLVKRNSYYSDDSAFRFFQLRNNLNHSSLKSRTGSILTVMDDDLSMKSLEETDLIESLNVDSVSISQVLGHLKSTGRGSVLGEKNFLYVLKPPYEDGLRKKRTLVTIIDLATGSCDVLREMIVESTTQGISSNTVPEKHRIGNVFHLFSASVTVQV